MFNINSSYNASIEIRLAYMWFSDAALQTHQDTAVVVFSCVILKPFPV